MTDFAGVRGLFPAEAPPTVISDSPAVLERFRGGGFSVASIADLAAGAVTPPVSAVLAPAAPARHPMPALNAALRESAVLLVPLLGFASEDRAVDYFFERLRSLDFAAACEKSRQSLEFIQHQKEPVAIGCQGRELRVALGETLDVFAPKLAPAIARGECISIIQFLEIAMVPNDAYDGFTVDGDLLCEGVSIAHHLHAHFEAGPIAHKAWGLLQGEYAAGRFPLTLSVRDSAVVSIRNARGEDLLDRVLPLTDPVYRGRITEFAIGSLDPAATVDWSVNSQLNEPAGGVHLGLGAGETGAHIDFVSPRATVAGLAA
ncbi:MAG: hypothetical protein NXI21_16705 [Alphaproteobacteria bacterium]|nr:hypothetical protein [Alphaproteobacteria bacterium]